MRRLTEIILLAAALAACDDGATAEGGDDVLVIEPADAAVDAAPEVDAEPPREDAAPPPLLAEPLANVYAHDPVTDDGALTEVVVHTPTDPQGHLTSEWVEVFNCLNEDGGVTAHPDLGGFSIEVQLCHEVQTVTPDADGHYLSVLPPEAADDPNDPFAEIMMYHHVNVVHDYFKDTHGFAGLDFPLPALVNVQLKTTPPLPIPGFMPGPDGWIPFPNAAFFPAESWEALAAQFGLPPRPDSIIFGQADTDFALDAPVIYHEYTHAVIGTGRLQAIAVADEYGLDASPRAMNEGLADYFGATITGESRMGVWAIGQLAPNQVRDLSQPHRCPGDLRDEVHHDGKVIGSALWAVREAFGAEVTDAIVWGALEQFSEATTHQVAAELMLAEAADAGVEAEVRAVFEDFGLVDCVRSAPWVRFAAGTPSEPLPHRVEGRNTVGIPGFGQGVPGYKQFHVDVPEGTLAVSLTWSLQGGGGLIPGQPGGAIEPLTLITRADAPVELSLEGEAAYVEDARYLPALEGSRQTLHLDASCLPIGGRLHSLFLNTGADPVNVVTMEVRLHDAIDEALPDLVVCDEAEPEPDEP